MILRASQAEDERRMVVETGQVEAFRTGVDKGSVERARRHVKGRWLCSQASVPFLLSMGHERTLPRAGQGWAQWSGHCVLLICNITRVCWKERVRKW